VVADTKHDDLKTPSGSWFYTPYFHVSRHPNFSWAINEVRIFGNAAAVATAIRATVKDTSPLIEAPEIHTINELVDQTVTTERMITTLCSFFGLLALLSYAILRLFPNAANVHFGGFTNGKAEDVGRALFTRYLLPFEVTSVLILIAIIGAIVLARKEL